MAKAKRAAIYSRVSTTDQTCANQERELREVADRNGWEIVDTIYRDEGISGAKGRDKRPGIDLLLKDAVRRKFDVIMAWSVDRLGRSMKDLATFVDEINDAKVDLFLLQQGIDTTTGPGKMIFHIMGAIAEGERNMIRERTNAGIARVKATGKTKSGRPTGRPRIPINTEAAIMKQLKAGAGIRATARLHGVGNGTVQRIKDRMAAA